LFVTAKINKFQKQNTSSSNSRPMHVWYQEQTSIPTVVPVVKTAVTVPNKF